MCILVGTYDLFDFRNLDAQAARRGRDLHFPRYHLDTMAERREFVGVLRSLLEHVPLACDMDDLLAHWRWFGELSIGCIGVLSDWMVDTVATLFREGGTTLTIEALQRSAPHPARRVRMEVDARTGEHKVEAGNATSHQQLQELLGKPARARSASFEGGASSETLPQPLTEPRVIDQPPVPTRGRMIERAPSRDPVGEMQPTGHATKCSFKGIIDLSPEEMKEARISRVECPECATTRSLDILGKTVRFPPHDRRKTSTPSREERWIRHGIAWTLSEKKT
jgi:hypothetical protein